MAKPVGMYLTSKPRVASVHTRRLRAHHVQPRLYQQQSHTNLGCQPCLSWSGQHRSWFVYFTASADAPDCNAEPAQQVRYKGVRTTLLKTYISTIMLRRKSFHLGTCTTPEEAAHVYDEACIFQRRDPVNFPKSQYDEAAILQIPDFDTFVEQVKKARGRQRANTSRRTRGMLSCLRFTGVHHGKSGKWISRAWVMARPGSPHVWLGKWPTQELAAQAYDKLCLYRGLDTKNLPKASYDLQTILMHETIDSLVASIRAEATELTKAQYSSRYTGVYKWKSKFARSFSYEVRANPTKDHNIHLGYYLTEEQAATSYDRYCIYRGRDPVNYPDHPYDKEEICQPESFAEFVQHSREQAARLVKAQQTSRFTGVTRHQGQSQWEGYVNVRTRKISLGFFDDEQEAARAVDERRKTLGQGAVNFPLKSNQTFESQALWLRSVTIAIEQGTAIDQLMKRIRILGAQSICGFERDSAHSTDMTAV